MIEMMQSDFVQNAVLVGVLASIACGIIGSYVVINRLSFISSSIAHTAFGGIGIAHYLGTNPLIGAGIFGVAASLLIGQIQFHIKQNLDAIIAMIWTIGMAIGIIFIAITPGYANDLFSYLFGNILLTSTHDLVILGILNIIILAINARYYRAIQALTYDLEFAKVSKLPVKYLTLLLYGLIGITIVILIKAVGVLLVIALLTFPAATAKLFTKNLVKMKTLASGLGTLATTSGIILSYVSNLPAGPMIILACCSLFGIGTLLKST